MSAINPDVSGTPCQPWSKRRAWITYVSMCLLLTGAGFLVLPHDIWLSRSLHEISKLPGDIVRILTLSELVAHGSGVFLILVLMWILTPHVRTWLPRIAACSYVAGMLANALKLCAARRRPIATEPSVMESSETWYGAFAGWSGDPAMLVDYVFQSFPSGHTATCVGFAVGLSWLYPKARYVFYLVAFLAAMQRIVFLAHWPSDVFIGAALGVFTGGAFTVRGAWGDVLATRLEQRMGRRLVAAGRSSDSQPTRRAA